MFDYKKIKINIEFFCILFLCMQILLPSFVNAFYWNNQSADVVIGQQDFVSSSANQGGLAGANTIANTQDVYTDGTKLFILEDSNNRALIYNSIPTSNNASANVVVGQPNFTSTGQNYGRGWQNAQANGFAYDYSIYQAGGKLFISEGGNHRILIFNSVPTSDGASANVVIGQTNFTSVYANQGGSVNANTLNGPYQMYSDGTKLFVADPRNNRVLIYNSIPTSNNASADVVIGQVDFTHNASGTTASTLNFPTGVYSDGTKLFISDLGNHRVLVYNSIPTSNGASADVVIGQTNFTSGVANQGGSVSANTLKDPIFVHSRGTKLFIGDSSNNRVLIYNSIPTSNGASADVVIGQANFTSGVANQGGSVGANTLSTPTGITSDNERLIIADYSNSRVLIYYLKPSAPIIGTPQALSSTSIRWNFTDNDTIETGFKLYDNLNNIISTQAVADLSYIDETGLTPNTQYIGRYIKSYNSSGESIASQTASIYTLPETPTGLTATTNSNNAITLTTNRFTNDTVGSSGYYFESSSGNNSGWTQANTWQDTALACGITYSYTVKHRNAESTQTSTISTIQATSTCAGGNAMQLLRLQSQSQQNNNQTQKQILIAQIKSQIADLIKQLILLLQEQIRNK